jgi:hypothetical protein
MHWLTLISSRLSRVRRLRRLSLARARYVAMHSFILTSLLLFRFIVSCSFLHRMAYISQAQISGRDNLVTLLEQQSTFLRRDINSRVYVVPNLCRSTAR